MPLAYCHFPIFLCAPINPTPPLFKQLLDISFHNAPLTIVECFWHLQQHDDCLVPVDASFSSLSMCSCYSFLTMLKGGNDRSDIFSGISLTLTTTANWRAMNSCWRCIWWIWQRPDSRFQLNCRLSWFRRLTGKAANFLGATMILFSPPMLEMWLREQNAARESPCVDKNDVFIEFRQNLPRICRRARSGSQPGTAVSPPSQPIPQAAAVAPAVGLGKTSKSLECDTAQLSICVLFCEPSKLTKVGWFCSEWSNTFPNSNTVLYRIMFVVQFLQTKVFHCFSTFSSRVHYISFTTNKTLTHV